MLWIYLDNQGVDQCVVNVGNKIRQGDSFHMFVVLPGMQAGEEAQEQELSRVAYLKPGSKEFEGPLDFVETSHEFVLGKPSEANAYFIGGTTYRGYDVFVDSGATTFYGNGGHVALEIVTIDPEGEFRHARTVSIYVEPTYGNNISGTNISSASYSALLQLVSLASFSKLVNMVSAGTDLGVKFLPGPSYEPICVFGNRISFVRGKVGINASTFASHADSDGYGLVAYCDMVSQSIPYGLEVAFVGLTDSGNPVRFKIAKGDHTVSLYAKVEDITGEPDPDGVSQYVSFFSTFATDERNDELLSFPAEETDVIKIENVTAVGYQMPPDYAGNLVTVNVVPNVYDSTRGTIEFVFSIPKGYQGTSITGVDIEPEETTAFGYKYSIGVELTDPSTGDTSSVSLPFTAPYGPQGEQGIQGIQGPRGYSITDVTVEEYGSDPNGKRYEISIEFSDPANPGVGAWYTSQYFVAPYGPQGPQGQNGVVTSAPGVIGFQVLDGKLYATVYENDTNVDLYVDPQSGQLMYDI